MNCPSLHTVHAAIFDFDGTLAETNIDFARMRAEVLLVAERWGLRDGLDERRYILEIVDQVLTLLPDDEARERFRREAEEAMQAVELEATSVADPFPGVPAALQALLDSDIRVGIITRNCRAGVRSVLNRHHIPHEVLLTRDDVELVKPDPAHLLKALEMLQVAPEQAVMVGDHLTDIETARAAGTLAAGVLTAGTTREQFEQARPDLIAVDVPEVVRHIRGGRSEGG
ncbi:MAG: HAD family hydrolase [Armatimonadetes bacterium]|nr:HAD family hydrolase [Armatimonadota bacterium]